MKRQKQYTSEEMILKDIKKAERSIARLSVKSDDIVGEIEILKFSGDDDTKIEIEKRHDAIRVITGKISRLRDTRLVKLKNTLASFRTCELPGMDVKSVVLQSK